MQMEHVEDGHAQPQCCDCLIEQVNAGADGTIVDIENAGNPERPIGAEES